MPCDIGYRSYTKVRIPTPNPQEFKNQTEAPQIDADLLEKLGVDDPEFLAWINELDTRPLLQEALNRALQQLKIPADGKLKFKIDINGYLQARGSYVSAAEKKRLSELAGQVAGRFQMETLQVIAQLLDYETELVQSEVEGEVAWKLEGEKNEPGSVHKYLCVTKRGDNTEIEFEHFDSPQSRDSEMVKYFALAQKLGVPLTVGATKKSGQPIVAGTVHRDFLKHKA